MPFIISLAIALVLNLAPGLSVLCTFVHELGHAFSIFLCHKKILPKDQKLFIEIALCHKSNKDKKGKTFSNVYDVCAKEPDKHTRFIRFSALSGMLFPVVISCGLYIVLGTLDNLELPIKIFFLVIFSINALCECAFFIWGKGKLSDKAIFCNPTIFSEYNGNDETEYKYNFTFCINF